MSRWTLRDSPYLPLLQLGAMILIIVVVARACDLPREVPDAALVAERDAAVAEANRWKAAAADSAALGRAWRDIAQREGEVVSDLLASREQAREHEQSARVERNRLASALTDARAEAARLREASDKAPESPQDARAALTACWDTLSACERLTAQQDTLIAAKDTTIARGDRAIVALQRQSAALDSTATRYESAYTGLLDGYTQRGLALDASDALLTIERGAHRKTKTTLTLTRLALAGVTLGAAYLIAQ